MSPFLDGFLLIVCIFSGILLTQIEPSQLHLVAIIATAASAGWLFRAAVNTELCLRPTLTSASKIWGSVADYLQNRVVGISLLLSGVVLGFGFSALLMPDAKEILNTLGSLGAGIGTIGLLLLALTKSNEWMLAAKENKRLDLAMIEAKSLLISCYNLSQKVYEVLDEKSVNSAAQNNCLQDAIAFLEKAQSSYEAPAKDVYLSINTLAALYEKHDPGITRKIEQLAKKLSDVTSHIFFVEELNSGKQDLSSFIAETEKTKNSATNLCVSARGLITEITQKELN